MDRYQKVERRKPESPIGENEIRITSKGVIRNYISYGTSLLQEKHANEIVLKAMGQAISRAVAIAEFLKKKIPRLHQHTVISSESITDVWEPIEEGLVPVEMTRQVSMISITLSTIELDKNSPGYQAPYVVEQPKQQYYYQQKQSNQPRAPYNAVNEDSQGRGRGRRGGRGRGWGNRGGRGNYQDNGGYVNRRVSGNYQDNGGYSRGDGYGNYQNNGGYPNRGDGYGNYQNNGGYSNRGDGYENYQNNGGYSNRGAHQDNGGGYSNYGRGGGRARSSRGGGYERGTRGGGRGYNRGGRGGNYRGGGGGGGGDYQA